MFFVYILESETTGKNYFGQTEDLEGRLLRHNSGRNISTRFGIPWKLKWWHEYESRSDAFKIEQKLKKLKSRAAVEKFVTENNFRGVAQSRSR